MDSTKEYLSTEIANEFINNRINISNSDLQRFIQSFLERKQQQNGWIEIMQNIRFTNSIPLDPLIDWTEFRDTFLPIIGNGCYTTDDLKRWFNILDVDHNVALTREQ